VGRQVLWLLVGVLAQRDLHELARAQRVVDRLDDSGRDALVPHVHGGFQVVRFGAELSALLG
jgi:hypothetical protein